MHPRNRRRQGVAVVRESEQSAGACGRAPRALRQGQSLKTRRRIGYGGYL